MPGEKKEGLKELEGETVELWCRDCIYKGTLQKVGKKDAAIEAAMWSAQKGPKPVWEDLPSDVWHVRLASIESFGLGA